MRQVKIIALMLLAVLFTLVVVQNTEVVTLRVFMYEITMSRIILLLITLAIGFIMGFLMAKLGHRKQARQQAPQP